MQILIVNCPYCIRTYYAVTNPFYLHSVHTCFADSSNFPLATSCDWLDFFEEALEHVCEKSGFKLLGFIYTVSMRTDLSFLSPTLQKLAVKLLN